MKDRKVLRRHRLKAGIDVDDVLFPCVEYAIEKANKEYKFNPPLSIDEITDWNLKGTRTEVVLKYFKDPDFYAAQPIFDGAVEFVKKLCEVVDVYFVTAVDPLCMGIRAKMLMERFPFIPSDRLIMTSSKNVVDLDILLDDGGHNILSTMAKYPVLFRRPWNQNITGILAVNNYEEFLVLLNEIIYSFTENSFDPTKPAVIGLVGPSASGKTSIAEELIETGKFGKPTSYTTRKPRNGTDIYHFVSKSEFLAKKKSGEIFESTVYAKEYYGTTKESVQEILDSGKHAIMPIDICGALGMKNNFSNTIIIYVDRKKTELLTSLLERRIPVEEKVNRILCIDAESRNEELCDFTVNNYGNIEQAAKQVLRILNME